MKRLLTTFLIAMGFAAASFAQEGAESALPEFADVDENEDGRIDREEAAELVESLEDSEVRFEFAVADANEDGAVDAAEYAEYREEMTN